MGPLPSERPVSWKEGRKEVLAWLDGIQCQFGSFSPEVLILISTGDEGRMCGNYEETKKGQRSI